MFLRSHLSKEFFISVTSFGGPVFYILVILVLLRLRAPFVLTLFLALLFVELFCVVIKSVYRKERPISQDRDDFFNKIDANSFPSVHSARISVLVTMISLYYKDVSILIIGIILALCVGYSRIYLKRHYRKDVLAGFLIGVIVAIIAFYI